MVFLKLGLNGASQALLRKCEADVLRDSNCTADVTLLSEEGALWQRNCIVWDH